MEAITGNTQFDFQIERFTSAYVNHESVQRDRLVMRSCIHDFDSWIDFFLLRAQRYAQNNEFRIAASYYRAALFYMTDDTQIQETYKLYQRYFYSSYSDFEYEKYEIPYEGSSLPCLYLKNPGASRTLLVFGGFDGYLEEVATFFTDMRNTDYDILIFDGPGQGITPSRGLRFTPHFEKPAKAVLDYFKLEEVDAIGLSFGGLLVMQAAAHDERIKRVIAMDIFYSPMDSLRMEMTALQYWGMQVLLTLHTRSLLNAVVKAQAKSNIQLQWQINNGYRLTKETNPYDLIKNLSKHNAKSVLPLVTQPCLLLAGSEDHYVPVYRLEQIKKELINSSSVRTKLFTKSTGGEQHCQMGAMNLAFDEIKKFLGSAH